MARLTIYLSLGLLAACASSPFPITSPYYRIPAGSLLILKQPLTIAPNKGRVYIQYGKPVDNMKPDRYYPHCWFIAWTISPDAVIIQPDQFNVIESKKYENYVGTQHPVMFASIAGAFNTGSSASITAVESLTELTIQSTRQADIRRFVCNQWGNPSDARHLTVVEINKTLGDIAELRPSNR